MVEWAVVNTDTIKRIGYNKEVQSLYVDFIGSEIDTAFVKVPEPLFTFFVEAKSPDKFFNQFVDGYFDVAKMRFKNEVHQLGYR